MLICKRHGIPVEYKNHTIKIPNRYRTENSHFEACEHWNLNSGKCLKDGRSCYKGKGEIQEAE
jgi:hypothetical protein